MLPSTTISLVERLGSKLPDDFSRTVLNGSVRALLDDNNPIRVNLFALGVEKRNRLARVVPEPCKVTRRDRMVNAIQGGIPDAVLNKIGINTAGLHNDLHSTVNGLNKHVHIQSENLRDPAASIVGLVEDVFTAVFDFLTAVEKFRLQVSKAVSEAVNKEVFTAFFLETVDDLDVLSTHTRIDKVQGDVTTVAIRASEVLMEAKGTVFVELVYGSGSDERSGSGSRTDDSYPFTMKLSASTSNLEDLQNMGLEVDTHSFYEDN